jgi:hypothetical protein
VCLTADVSGGLKSHSARGPGLISKGGGNASPAVDDGRYGETSEAQRRAEGCHLYMADMALMMLKFRATVKPQDVEKHQRRVMPIAIKGPTSDAATLAANQRLERRIADLRKQIVVPLTNQKLDALIAN